MKYPLYVISKGRYDCCLTADFLIEDNTPFHLVVEPQEFELYAENYGKDRIYVLPFSNLGLGSIPARNWVWEHSKGLGFKRHWILDDNIRSVKYSYKGKRVRCNSKKAFISCENFVERYENIAIAGLDYEMFGIKLKSPYKLNTRIYSCLLILNELPYRWRGRYNEDTDLSLQVLKHGWCTVLFDIFLIQKMRTMTMKGGNTDELYKGDGRLKMAYSLKQQHPSLVKVVWKFNKWQHSVNYILFKKNKLVRRKDIDWNNLKDDIDFNIVLNKDIKSNEIKEIVETYGKANK
jgi:hypothetical protein